MDLWLKLLTFARSLPAWGAWIEILTATKDAVKDSSLPAWGAWIEISIKTEKCDLCAVAPRMGSVD